MISANILQKMLKQDLALQILKDTDHYLKTKIKKVTRLMKNELGRLTMKDFDWLRAKTYSYLKDNNDEDKKSKRLKKCFIKKLKFQGYKNCLEAAQIENKRNHLAKKLQLK